MTAHQVAADRAGGEQPGGNQPGGDRPGTSRRGALGLFGAAAAAAGAASWVGAHTGATVAEASPVDAAVGSLGQPIEFHGPHQAGIATPVQDRLHLVAFDLLTDDRAALTRLLQRWTEAARRLSRGLDVDATGADPSDPGLPPGDTGEAVGLPPARLTLTVGFGPGIFEADGKDRFGLRAARPEGLIELPRFAGDRLDPARSGGDLVVQACADDPQVAVHAIRNLARIAMGTAQVRWSQLGFGKTSSTTPDQATPRNLFGFKDGTRNISGDDTAGLARHVWIDGGRGATAWANGGSYLVARRIAMRIESWDRTTLEEQQQVTGRFKASGAPLHARAEHDPVDVAKLPADSHVALAHPDSNNGHRLLRRGYSFVDGSTGLGRLDAGLFFIAFCRDPQAQYVPMQRKLSSDDAMAEYVVHTGSGLWVVPPGVGPDGYWGQSLLEA